MFVQWNDECQILTDEMGVPLSHTDAKQVARMLKIHLKKSPAELAEIIQYRFAKKYPISARKITFTEQDFV